MKTIIPIIWLFVSLMIGTLCPYPTSAAQNTNSDEKRICEEPNNTLKVAQGWNQRELIEIPPQTLLKNAEDKFKEGRIREAINLLSRAHENLGKIKDTTLLALIHGRRGTACMTIGHMDYAEKELRLAISIAEEGNQLPIMGGLYNDLGNLFATKALQLKDETSANESFAKAFDSYFSALLLAKEISRDVNLSVMTTLNIAKAYILNQRYQDAHKQIIAASMAVKNLTNPREKAERLVAIGVMKKTLISNLPDLKESLFLGAKEDFLEVLRITQLRDTNPTVQNIQDTRIRSLALGHLGSLWRDSGILSKALSLTTEAKRFAEKINAPDVSFKWEWQEAQLHKELGNTKEAIEAYLRAKATLKKIPRYIPIGFRGKAQSFRQGPGRLFIELSHIYLKRAGKLDAERTEEEEKHKIDNWEAWNLHQAREMMEEFKTAEIQDFYQNDCIEAYGETLTLVDKIVTRGAQHESFEPTAILYPIVLPDRLELLVSFGEEIKRFQSIKINEETLAEKVNEFRIAIQDRSNNTYRTARTELYKWLISPVLAALTGRNISTLVIVPDGPLRTIPFSALYNNISHKYLFQEFAIATGSGLRFPDPKPIQYSNIKVLALGLRGLDSPNELPYVKIELEKLEKTISNAKGEFKDLQEEGFTMAAVEKEMENESYTIVHMATHSYFAETVQDSYLKTFDNRLKMSDLRQMIGLFKFRENPLDLLTLSACETASGSNQAALGLAGAALNAGAKSVLATLWQVDDGASEEIVSNFYKYLLEDNHPRLSKARALQKAQEEFLTTNSSNRNDFDLEHPFYWSPFLLLDNWL